MSANKSDLSTSVDLVIQETQRLREIPAKTLQMLEGILSRQGLPQPANRAYEQSRAVLIRVVGVYDDVIAVLRDEPIRTAPSAEPADTTKVAENLRGLRESLSAWLKLESGKIAASDETEAIWNNVISTRSLDPAHKELYAEFRQERNDAQRAFDRITAAIEHLDSLMANF